MPKRQTQRIIDSRRRNSSATIIGATGSGVPVSLTAGDGLVLTGTTLDVVAGDGVSVAADSVAVDSTVVRTTRTVTAGSGLTGGGALSADLTLNVGAGTLVTVGADTVGITAGSSYQFIGTGNDTIPEWRNVSELAGNGLTAANGVLAVGVANTGAVGLSVEADAIRLTSSSAPGAAARVLATDANGYLSLVRLTLSDRLYATLVGTASGNLTIAPAADLVLSPVSNLVKLASGKSLQSDNYASQATGMRVTYAGEGDFRYLFVDEMHAKSFIADLEQALAGGQIISKSVAVLATAFTAPAASGTATLRVRDLPSAADMACFQSGDIVRLRQFSRSSGSLTIADCWGVVTSYADQADGTQTWTFTRSAAPNAGAMAAGTVVAADAIVLDYGTTGNGYYEVNAIDGAYGLNSPYARIVSWTTHPATGQALRVQMGNLRGVYGYASTIYGVGMGDPAGANVTIEATNGVRLRQGTTDMIVLDPAGNSYFAGVMTIGTSGEIRQGTGTLGSNFTGLRLWRDSSIGRIGGYNANTLQWYGDTSGNFVAGAGYVLLNANGIRQTVANVKSDVTEPSSTPVVPSVGQRLSFYDSADAADWGYTYPGGTDYDYFYPGMEWLRIYVSSQHFVQPQPYTTTVTDNYHVYDAVIDMPNQTFTTNAGTIQRRRLLLRSAGGSIELESPSIVLGNNQTNRTVLDSGNYYAPRVQVNTSGGWARQLLFENLYSGATMQASIGAFGGATGSSRIYLTHATSDPYNNMAGVHVLSSGNVGVNTNAPSATLDVNGRILATTVGYDWSALTPSTGWQNTGGSNATFGVKRFGNMVAIKGMVSANTSLASGSTVYTLASEYRPTATRVFNCRGYIGSAATTVQVNIQSDGQIRPQVAFSSGDWLSLEITYFTGG